MELNGNHFETTLPSPNKETEEYPRLIEVR